MTDNNKIAFDDDLIQRAKAFASAGFRLIDHRRKYTNEPYEVHTIEVASIVAGSGGDAEMVAAAHLHDTVEDVKDADGNPIEPYTLNGIREFFGDRVANLVSDLTNVYTRKDYPSSNRKIRHGAEADRLHTIHPDAQTIKYADFISNTYDITTHDPKFAKVYLAEKQAILSGMRVGNPSLYRRALEPLWIAEEDKLDNHDKMKI